QAATYKLELLTKLVLLLPVKPWTMCIRLHQDHLHVLLQLARGLESLDDFLRRGVADVVVSVLGEVERLCASIRSNRFLPFLDIAACLSVEGLARRTSISHCLDWSSCVSSSVELQQ